MARGRKPQVRYWNRKGGGYFTTLRGEQIELALGPDDWPNGPTYLKAIAAFSKLLSQQEHIGSNSYLLSACFNQYRQYLEGEGRELVLRQFEIHCKSLSELHGSKPIREIEPYLVNEWLRTKTSWSDSTKSHAISLILAACNWAVGQGYIPSHPLAGRLKRPEMRTRGREARMSPELCQLILDFPANTAWKLVTKILHQTGCRPAELFHAKRKNLEELPTGPVILHRWNPARGDFVHKTARKTKRDRIICLPGALAEEVRGQMGRSPEGPLLVTLKGKAWTATNYQQYWHAMRDSAEVREYCEKNSISPATLIPYNFRHTYISEWIDSGRSLQVCARLCGTSVSMIEKVYGHPDNAKLYDHFLTHHSSRECN